jgi:ribosomal protein L23
VGRFSGRKSDRRKAYVRLQPGQKPVEYFEGR